MIDTSKILNLAHTLHEAGKQIDEIICRHWGSQENFLIVEGKMSNPFTPEQELQEIWEKWRVFSREIYQPNRIFLQTNLLMQAMLRQEGVGVG